MQEQVHETKVFVQVKLGEKIKVESLSGGRDVQVVEDKFKRGKQRIR